MKNIILILCIVISCVLSAKAQITTPSFNVSGKVFLCKNIGNLLSVYNQSNIYHKQQRIFSNEQCFKATIFSEEYVKISNTLKLIFTPNRINELLNEKGFSIWLYLDEVGNVKEVFYRLSENTILTPIEILNMENKLKLIKLNCIYTNCAGIGYRIFNHYIKFSTLL